MPLPTNFLAGLITLTFLAACGTTQEAPQASAYVDPEAPGGSAWYRFPPEDAYELGMPCGYSDAQGDTLIPSEKYTLCLTDTATVFAVVWDETDYVAINRKGQRLYEIYTYDNGPDWLEDGLFRIKRNGLVGYADAQGQIVIPPQYTCANPFEDGKARVALRCELVPDGEYTRMESDEWFFIDTKGNRISDQ